MRSPWARPASTPKRWWTPCGRAGPTPSASSDLLPDGRYFLGVDLTDDARHALAARLDPWVPDLPGKRVPPQNWHVTLRFLGQTTGVAAERTVGALDEADLDPAFPIRLGGLGAFPRPRRATVLWVGVDAGDAPLAALAAAAEESARGAGMTAEERPFHGHLTLSRIRPQQDVTALVGAVEPTAVSWVVNAVTLFCSHLGPGGARYERVEQVLLR